MRYRWITATLLTLASSSVYAIECAPDQITLLVSDTPVMFSVELALTPEDQARGLMFRPSMPQDAGMIFVMEPDRRANFWMRNTMISLDLVFIDRSGVVESISERAVPFSERQLSSKGPVRAVLEINGGLSEELGILPGTQAIHEIFTTAPQEHRCPAG